MRHHNSHVYLLNLQQERPEIFCSQITSFSIEKASMKIGHSTKLKRLGIKGTMTHFIHNVLNNRSVTPSWNTLTFLNHSKLSFFALPFDIFLPSLLLSL